MVKVCLSRTLEREALGCNWRSFWAAALASVIRPLCANAEASHLSSHMSGVRMKVDCLPSKLDALKMCCTEDLKHVGNYGEIFEEKAGKGSPLKIRRGQNALWTKGGLQYAPPIR